MEISPSIYEHAAQLINVSPWEASRDGELMYQAHAAAYRTYRHTPIMPGIDIYNLEVEAYGAKIEQPSDNAIPAVRNHPFHSIDEILKLPPLNAEKEIRKEADRVIALCRTRKNVCLGTGALPYEANVDNVLYVMDYVRGIE